MLAADEAHALAARARLVARAVVGLVFEEQRAARFVHAYCSDYRRPGLAGEAERKAEFLGAIERESLLLVAARIEHTLPPLVGSRFSSLGQSEVAARFREAYLTFLGGSLAWDGEERESFRKDLAMYLRLASREAGALEPRAPARLGGSRGMPASADSAPAAGAFVDRCAFLVDPSMLVQAREAAARYQAELESCADEAVRAAFRGLRASASRARPRRSSPRRKPSRPAKRRSRRPARRSRTRAPARRPRPRQRLGTARQENSSPRARRKSRRRRRR